MNETKIKITMKKNALTIYNVMNPFLMSYSSCSGDVGAVLTVHWRNDDNRSGSRSGRENGEIGTGGATNPI